MKERFFTTSKLLAVRSEMEVCSGFVPGIAGSNINKSMYIGLFCCCVMCSWRPLLRNFYSFKRVLMIVFLSNCMIWEPQQIVILELNLAVSPQKIRNINAT